MADKDGKVPIAESVRAGFAFMRSSAPVLFPAAALLAAVAGAAQTLLSIGPSGASLGWAFFALAQIGQLAYSAFLLRLALREDASGFFGLQFGADEVRFVGVFLVTVMIALIVSFVGLIVFATFIASIAKQSGIDVEQMGKDPAAAQAALAQIFSGSNGVIGMGIIAFFVSLLAWISVRLCLAYPATIGEQRVMILSTFSWTKGNSLAILAVIFLTAFPLAAGLIVSLSLIGSLINFVFAAPDAAFTPKAGGAIPFALLQFVTGLGEFVLIVPALMGAYAYLYRGLRPPEVR